MRSFIFILSVMIGCFLSCSLVYAGPPVAPVLHIERDGRNVTASWTTPSGATGYRLSYVPFGFNPDLSKVTRIEFDVNTTNLSVILEPSFNYFVAVQAFNNDGLSSYSNIEIANPDLSGKVLQQLNRYLHQWKEYEFNNFIRLGNYDLFEDTMSLEGFDIYLVEEDELPRQCPDNSVACFGKGYNLLGFHTIPTGAIWITNNPDSMSDDEDGVWHEMIHAINWNGENKFLLDNSNDNHIQIEYYGEAVSKIHLRKLVEFEEYASRFIENYTVDKAETARKKWNRFFKEISPKEIFPWVTVTQAHIDELKTVIGFDVDPETIRDGYISMGYPEEFFYESTFKLPDTGQTVSYTDVYGEDSDYTINAPSYTDNGNGTVTDNNTGLMWQQDDDNTQRNWDDAISYCVGLLLAGHSDWRLPDYYELGDIVNLGNHKPAIDVTYFPNTNSSRYWSSTPNVDYAGSVWYVDFKRGFNSFLHYEPPALLYVRCVRGGQNTAYFTDNGNGTVTDNITGLMWQQEDDDVERIWEDAIMYCEGHSLAGKSDWRLPNYKELKSIVNLRVKDPAIDKEYFPNTDSFQYWTSTTDNDGSVTAAWYVEFNLGRFNDNSKVNEYYVRCVRGGK